MIQSAKLPTILNKIIRVFDITKPNTKPKMFEPVSGILFWDDIANEKYNEIHDEITSNYWKPNDVSMSEDVVHWINRMNDEEKELYKTGIGVLATLDSVSTYFDTIASHYIQDSAIKAVMSFIAGIESIHNKSYTYTMSSLVSKEVSQEAFERPKKNPFIIKRDALMMDVFNNFVQNPTVTNFAKSLVAMSGLEGVSFVNGFTPFYHFNRNNKMFGTGTIIQYIQRDETQHSYFQSVVVRDIMTQYPEVNTPEFAEWCYKFYEDLVSLERDFCEDLYKDIYDIDLDEVSEYIGYRANVVLDNLGLDKIFPAKKNPMLWIKAFEPENLNNVKRDFFEDKEINYKKVSEDSNGWGEL